MKLTSLLRIVPFLAAAGAASLLVSCGGGTDVAPSQPVVGAGGQAAVMLGGRDLGATTQVQAGVSGVQNALTTATGEVVTFGSDGLARLVHGLLPAQAMTLTGTSGSPVYCQGGTAACAGVPTCPAAAPTTPCDYWIEDLSAGVLRARSGGAVPLAPATVLATYQYNERLLAVNVGMTFADGQYVQLVVFNVPSRASVPLVVTAYSPSAPGSPTFDQAYSASAVVNLTTLASRQTFSVVDDPSNVVTLTTLDLSNEAQPCVGGDFTILVRSDADPTPVVLDGSFESPGC